MRRDSWLVQQLGKPSEGNFLSDCFAFGGGLRNGGLSDDAFKLLRKIFSFEYMGAAEFEFGALPEALQCIAKAKLEAFTVQWPLNKVQKHWRDNSKKKLSPKTLAEVYVIAPEGDREEIANRIMNWASDKPNALKCPTRLSSALRPVEGEKYHGPVGWLELDNGFFFFTDREMFKATANLFGVETGTSGSVVKG